MAQLSPRSSETYVETIAHELTDRAAVTVCIGNTGDHDGAKCELRKHMREGCIPKAGPAGASISLSRILKGCRPPTSSASVLPSAMRTTLLTTSWAIAVVATKAATNTIARWQRWADILCQL